MSFRFDSLDLRLHLDLALEGRKKQIIDPCLKPCFLPLALASKDDIKEGRFVKMLIYHSVKKKEKCILKASRHTPEELAKKYGVLKMIRFHIQM